MHRVMSGYSYYRNDTLPTFFIHESKLVRAETKKGRSELAALSCESHTSVSKLEQGTYAVLSREKFHCAALQQSLPPQSFVRNSKKQSVLFSSRLNFLVFCDISDRGEGA